MLEGYFALYPVTCQREEREKERRESTAPDKRIIFWGRVVWMHWQILILLSHVFCIPSAQFVISWCIQNTPCTCCKHNGQNMMPCIVISKHVLTLTMTKQNKKCVGGKCSGKKICHMTWQWTSNVWGALFCCSSPQYLAIQTTLF